jgi:hypothetical protein
MELEKLDLASASITDEQKAKLKSLFPEAITEGGKIDFDRLKATRGEAAEAVRGFGSARSRSWQGVGPEMLQGTDNLTKSTQATSSVRTTELNWQTFLRAIDSVSG